MIDKLNLTTKKGWFFCVHRIVHNGHSLKTIFSLTNHQSPHGIIDTAQGKQNIGTKSSEPNLETTRTCLMCNTVTVVFLPITVYFTSTVIGGNTTVTVVGYTLLTVLYNAHQAGLVRITLKHYNNTDNILHYQKRAYEYTIQY